VVDGGCLGYIKITKPIQQFDISLNRSFMNKIKSWQHAFDLFNSNQINAIIICVLI
jgi:hypothetical protein